MVVFDGYSLSGRVGGTRSTELGRSYSPGKFKKQGSFNTDEQVYSENMVYNKTDEDADILVVKTAFAPAPIHESVIIFGDDVDCPLGNCCFRNMYFMTPGKRKVEQKIFWPQRAIYETIVNHILFTHTCVIMTPRQRCLSRGK